MRPPLPVRLEVPEVLVAREVLEVPTRLMGLLLLGLPVVQVVQVAQAAPVALAGLVRQKNSALAPLAAPGALVVLEVPAVLADPADLAPWDRVALVALVAQADREGLAALGRHPPAFPAARLLPVRAARAAPVSFGVDRNDGTPPTPCSFVQAGGSKARVLESSPKQCGKYTVSSGWSGQFGPGHGFTTLSVIDKAQKLIVWPAYTDAQLAGMQTVKPDQSYPQHTLP
ncbi:hypothetical protein GGTG_14116 [Gaeumannomyces tritici R3-111a-1]|uniref:Uncharacterized protein n=1 Tax=Gaeumannomyces tritici (strain R3-111a-1) TaxID=644352 RepID=J3PKQ3_GAET3|nr:hypothetical protein GGTG_14116 [Gaeumannomyces tritici R3-111a-1]EJT68307.1 hypothetical protein GGTG_14116 [Gaeumannomyces tritici R3-111a-1]